MGPVLDSTSQSQGGRPISSLPLVKVVHVPAKGEDSSEDPELLLFAEVFIPPLPGSQLGLTEPHWGPSGFGISNLRP